MKKNDTSAMSLHNNFGPHCRLSFDKGNSIVQCRIYFRRAVSRNYFVPPSQQKQTTGIIFHCLNLPAHDIDFLPGHGTYKFYNNTAGLVKVKNLEQTFRLNHSCPFWPFFYSRMPFFHTTLSISVLDNNFLGKEGRPST